MKNILRYGPNNALVKLQLWLSWPTIILGKRLSNVPYLRSFINLFFKAPHNELTSIPIKEEVSPPDTTPVPRKVLEKLMYDIKENIFVLNECMCHGVMDRKSPRMKIGCIAYGPATRRIHPSHGRFVSPEEAVSHIGRAAEAGLVANLAHVWIDALAFQLPDFKRLMFICFCDDNKCLYRKHMKVRGPELNRTYKKLPGLSIRVNAEKCNGCGICIEKCFVNEMRMINGKATISADCKACGMCIETCKQNAIELIVEDEKTLYRQLQNRVEEMSNVPYNFKK
ncbi:MAG: hypothetical protein CVV44_23160 [Spirochaetae bacterium HGW-Spirochaetae-1]|jgi:ferredoxin|nr:MAG: hypothetical protein CVV44_23160 [Spirochaetae bacterium HGW-Spirochaetae-1]